MVHMSHSGCLCDGSWIVTGFRLGGIAMGCLPKVSPWGGAGEFIHAKHYQNGTNTGVTSSY